MEIGVPETAGRLSLAVLGGCGHVGLPLALSFAAKGCEVTIVDINPVAVEAVKRGEVGFMEDGAEELLRRHVGKNLQVTTDLSSIRGVDTVVCVIGTPIDEHLNPQLDKLLAVVDGLSEHMNARQLFVLRSTVFPGATQTVASHLQERVPGVDVAFCPERVAQGHSLREIASLPQIVSGTTPRARQRARALFGLLTEKIIELETTEAELSKLFCNSWRYIVFAAANQFYSLCADNGIDYYGFGRRSRAIILACRACPRRASRRGPASLRTRCSSPRITTMTLRSDSRQCSSTRGFPGSS
jgi:UDP-N-acetyl-D-mannosaminuronic acid dehydrogenase